MIKNLLSKSSPGQSLAEITLIILGVLIALGFDEWRTDIADKKALQSHLFGIVQEIDSNLRVLNLSRDVVLKRQVDALEGVINVLDRSNPVIENPEQFVEMVIESTKSPGSWFTRNSFESFRASKHYHSLHLERLAVQMSAGYESPIVLYKDTFGYGDAYKDLVTQLIPARFQSDNNVMRRIVPTKFKAPVIRDQRELSEVTNAIIDDRAQLLKLARYKAERQTAKWYQMTRINLEFQWLREVLLKHPLMSEYDESAANEVSIPRRHEILENYDPDVNGLLQR